MYVVHSVCALPDGRGYGRLDHAPRPRGLVEQSAKAFGYERIIGFADSCEDADAIIEELNRLLALTKASGPPASPDLDELERTPK